MTVTERSSAFIDSVLHLQPRLAVFDCDGTLWSGDAGEGFFDWELKRGVVSDDVVRWARNRYADYKVGKVSEDDMCGEMVTLHRGLRETDVLALAHDYFEQHFVRQIFPEMRELIHRGAMSGRSHRRMSGSSELRCRISVLLPKRSSLPR
jgi:phosphoserine phosphatase